MRAATTRTVNTWTEHWKVRTPFRISGHVWEGFDIVVVAITQGATVGRGEAEGIYFRGETVQSVQEQIRGVAAAIEKGATRKQLQKLLPAGGARSALDCALWDLEAQLLGTSVWKLAGVEPKPVKTVFTIGLEDTPEQMAAKAREAKREFPLKVKLGADRPVERIAAIRAARPDAQLQIDINGGWTFQQLMACAPRMKDLGVSLIEQPLAPGHDAALEGYVAPLPLFADESCVDRRDLPDVEKRYHGVVIKLDKAGGLTESLAIANEAGKRGLRLMAGCMTGTSLMMAPTHVVAQHCEIGDMDAPLLLAEDRVPGMRYDGAMISPPKGGSWGA